MRGPSWTACVGAAWDALKMRVQAHSCPRPCCRIDFQLAQDPNSSNLGTTVWDASMVLAKYIEKASDPATDIQPPQELPLQELRKRGCCPSKACSPSRKRLPTCAE